MSQLHYSGIIVEIHEAACHYKLTGLFLSTESNSLYEYFDPVYYNNKSLSTVAYNSSVRLLLNPKNHLKIPYEYSVLPQNTEWKARDKEKCYSFYCYYSIYMCITHL